MPDRLFLKPAEGVIVPKPQGGVLPSAGDRVERDTYWLRRIADGDVTETEPPADAEPTTAAPRTPRKAP